MIGFFLSARKKFILTPHFYNFFKAVLDQENVYFSYCTHTQTQKDLLTLLIFSLGLKSRSLYNFIATPITVMHSRQTRSRDNIPLQASSYYLHSDKSASIDQNINEFLQGPSSKILMSSQSPSSNRIPKKSVN